MIFIKEASSYFTNFNGNVSHRSMCESYTHTNPINVAKNATKKVGKFIFYYEGESDKFSIGYNSNAKAKKAIKMGFNEFPVKKFISWCIALGVDRTRINTILKRLFIAYKCEVLGWSYYSL